MTETTIGHAVDLAIKITDVEAVSSPENVDTTAVYGYCYKDIPRRIPDSIKPQREVVWHLQTDVEEGIRRTIEWTRANPWYLEESGGIARHHDEAAVWPSPTARMTPAGMLGSDWDDR